MHEQVGRQQKESPFAARRLVGHDAQRDNLGGPIRVAGDKAFAKLDSYLWQLSYKWARRSHPNKSRRRVAYRYFDAFNKSRRDRWVFGDRDGGAYLLRHDWTKIVRHQLVPGTASPDDPALADYWARRRQRHPPPLDGVSPRLLKVTMDSTPLSP